MPEAPRRSSRSPQIRSCSWEHAFFYRVGIEREFPMTEQFDNDGSIGSILLKNVKRVMGNIAESFRSRSLPDNAGLSNTASATVVLLGLVCGGS
jgi:hypothetical protein